MEDLKTREKLKDIYKSCDLEGLVREIDSCDKPPIEKAVRVAAMIQDTELKAVSDYSSQFIKMINEGSGYRTPAEWPYVICGMRLAVRGLLQLPLDPAVKKHIKELNEQVKKIVVPNVGFVGKKEEKDDV